MLTGWPLTWKNLEFDNLGKKKVRKNRELIVQKTYGHLFLFTKQSFLDSHYLLYSLDAGSHGVSTVFISIKIFQKSFVL